MKLSRKLSREGLELMKRERENAVRALAEETAAHAATRAELQDRDEKARTRAMFFATELEDAGLGVRELREGGFTPEELTLVSFTAQQVRERQASPFTLTPTHPHQVRDAGVTLTLNPQPSPSPSPSPR